MSDEKPKPPSRKVVTPYGTFYLCVTGAHAIMLFLPVGQLGRVEFQLKIRGDECLSRAMLDAIGPDPEAPADLKALRELGAQLDASYPNYLPSGVYSAFMKVIQ